MAGHELDLGAAALERRTASLRALACALLRDEHAAADVVQDAWLATLQAGARPRDPVAWMVGATQKLVARAFRRRRRGEAREREAARPASVPSTETLAVEAEVLRLVATEVARLEEPYRTTILLRYYHDLGPREMAASLGIPVSTVKTRLRRGLGILRGRMRTGHGSRAWMLVLAPIESRKTKALAAGGAWVSTKAKTVIALVAALLLIAAWWGLAGGRTAEAPRAGRSARDAATGTPQPGSAVLSPKGEGAGPAGPWAEVVVEAPDGRPVPGAEVRVAPLDRWNEATTATTDEQGRARLAEAAEGHYQVTAESAAFVRGGGFARFPGALTIRLRQGCRLKLRPVPWPHPAWAEYHWGAQGEVHVARKLAIDAGEVDTGVWPAGVVSIYRSPLGGGDVRSVRIALPASGEVVHELRLPERRSVEIQVEEAESGAVLHEWAAWDVSSKSRKIARREGSRFGVYRLFGTGRLIQVEAPGYARHPLWLPRNSEAPLRVELHRGIALRLSFAPGSRPVEALVYYNSPAGPSAMGVSAGPGVGLRPGEELNLTARKWQESNLLRRLGEKDAWRADRLPAESRLDVVVRNDSGHWAYRQVVTGMSGTETSVALRWPDVVRRTVVVRGVDGRPLAGVEVRIVDLRRGVCLGSLRTDARGRGAVTGFLARRSYAAETLYRAAMQRHDLDDSLAGPEAEIVLTVEEPTFVPRRVLVLDEAGQPVAGVRVQFGVRNGWGTFAVTRDDGVAVGRLAAPELYLVAVQWEPGVNSGTLMRPPDEDPIVFRGSLGRVPVRVELQATGLVHLRLYGGKRDRSLTVHVHGRGVARFPIAVKPGEYRLQATLGGRTLETAFVARAREPVQLSLSFER